MGGLHNWVKFYLEERRGAARYLGPRYKGTGKHDAALNPYFVSGKFTWDLNGKHLATGIFMWLIFNPRVLLIPHWAVKKGERVR